MSRIEHIAKLEREYQDSMDRGLLPEETFEDFVARHLELMHNIASWKAYDQLLPEEEH